MTYLKVLLSGHSAGCARSVYLSQGQFVQAPALSHHSSIITASLFPLVSSSVFNFDQMVHSVFVFPQKVSTVQLKSNGLRSPGTTCPFD